MDMLLLRSNPTIYGLKMGANGLGSSPGWGRILWESDKFSCWCLGIARELLWVKLVCDVMQKCS